MISGLPVARLGSVGRLRGSVPLVLGPNNRYLSHRGSADTRNPGSPCCFFFLPTLPLFRSPPPSLLFRLEYLSCSRSGNDALKQRQATSGAQTLLSPVLQHNFAPSDSMCAECDGTGVGGTGGIVLIRLEASGHLVTTEHARRRSSAGRCSSSPAICQPDEQHLE